MISLDQVYLLEQKVESAVEKIQQLQAENDALRSKCNELTNALSVKSEQLSNFESDQSQIETGIKKALDRLNSIENSVLKTAVTMNQSGQAASTVTASAPKPVAAPVQNIQNTAPSFDTMSAVPEVNEEPKEEPVSEEQQDFFPDETFEGEEDTEIQEDDNHDGLGFDIF